MISKGFLAVFAISLTSCDSLIRQEVQDTTYSRLFIPYELQNPDKKTALPYKLEEISGLVYYKEGYLLSIDDDEGSVYALSVDGVVADRLKFDRGSDYEGIAVAGNNIWVVKANGDLHKIKKGTTEDKKFNTPLRRDNDVEGLTFDEKNNRLLLACKDEPGIEEELSGRAIYAFDLTNNSLSSDPVILITLEELDKQIKEREEELEITSFAPSGIAIHPVSKYIYILSHQGKVLAVYDQEFNLLELVKLAREHYKQPEGICFSPDGKKLFISNEGRGGRANLLQFSQLND